MKKILGLFILVILLAAVSGCTQTAKPTTPVTTIQTAAPTTEIPAVMTTALPATVPAAALTTAQAAVTTAKTAPLATPAPSTTFSKTNIIHIVNNTFIPAELTVLPGTGVSWINDDSAIHTVKAVGQSKGKFTSADLVNGAHFLYTFGEEPGSFEFADPAYPTMKGTIIVRKGDTLWIATGTPVTQSPK
jgi:plastocyanin